MRCLHPQTDNPRQSSADCRSVLEGPANDAHELRINLTRWADAFYARFCVGPGLDQAHPCTASAPGPRPSTTSTTTACRSPRVPMADRSSAETWTNTSSAAAPHDEAAQKVQHKNYFLRRQCFPKQTNCRT